MTGGVNVQVEKLNTKSDELREHLDAAWVSGRIAEACGIFVEELRPRCIRWLLGGFSSISEEDAEDCFDAAIDGVLRRDPGKVNDVYNYMFTSARNNALDLVQERKYFARFDPEWIEGASDDRLLVVAEAALDEELTVKVDQLRTLYALTLPKLGPRRRRLAKLLLVEGVGSSNEALAEMMDTSKEALKSLKSRTLSDLRRLLPISADELGIDFEQVLSPPPEVLLARPSLPSGEDMEGSG